VTGVSGIAAGRCNTSRARPVNLCAAANAIPPAPAGPATRDTPGSAWLLPKPYAAGSAGADGGLQLRAPREELRDIVIRHRGLIGRFLKTLFDHLQGIAQIGTTEA